MFLSIALYFTVYICGPLSAAVVAAAAADCPSFIWLPCCCFISAAAATVSCQAAAPSAAGCSSCSAARAAPSCSAAATDVAAAAPLCNAVLPCPGLNLRPHLLAPANQQLSLLGRTCLNRPGQDSVAASLSLVQTIIRSSDKDLQQTGCIHPDCPCPPIAVLQPPLQSQISYNVHTYVL